MHSHTHTIIAHRYYDESGEWKGEIFIGGCNAAELDAFAANGRDHAFCIYDREGNEVLTLAAHSHEERREWVFAINTIANE